MKNLRLCLYMIFFPIFIQALAVFHLDNWLNILVANDEIKILLDNDEINQYYSTCQSLLLLCLNLGEGGIQDSHVFTILEWSKYQTFEKWKN